MRRGGSALLRFFLNSCRLLTGDRLPVTGSFRIFRDVPVETGHPLQITPSIGEAGGGVAAGALSGAPGAPFRDAQRSRNRRMLAALGVVSTCRRGSQGGPAPADRRPRGNSSNPTSSYSNQPIRSSPSVVGAACRTGSSPSGDRLGAGSRPLPASSSSPSSSSGASIWTPML